MNTSTAAERFREAMMEVGLNQGEVASRLGLKTSFVNAIANGRKGIGAKTLTRLKEKLGFNPDYILTGQGEILIKPKGFNVVNPVVNPVVSTNQDSIETTDSTIPINEEEILDKYRESTQAELKEELVKYILAYQKAKGVAESLFKDLLDLKTKV